VKFSKKKEKKLFQTRKGSVRIRKEDTAMGLIKKRGPALERIAHQRSHRHFRPERGDLSGKKTSGVPSDLLGPEIRKSNKKPRFQHASGSESPLYPQKKFLDLVLKEKAFDDARQGKNNKMGLQEGEKGEWLRGGAETSSSLKNTGFNQTPHEAFGRAEKRKKIFFSG